MSMKMNWIYNTFYTSLTLIDQIVNLIIEINYVSAKVYIKDLNCENFINWLLDSLRSYTMITSIIDWEIFCFDHHFWKV